MKVTCMCGSEFEARHPRARFCSDRCRKRSQRRDGQAAPTEAPAEAAGAVEAAVRAELTAGQLKTAVGVQCLVLARRLDRPGMDTGSAMTSVSRELRSLMAEVARGGRVSGPQRLQDELAERRRQHAASAGSTAGREAR